MGAGFVIRKTGKAGLVTVGTTALSATAYLLIMTQAACRLLHLPRHFPGISVDPMTDVEKRKDQWVLLFLGVSIAGTFSGLVVTLISKAEAEGNIQIPLNFQHAYRSDRVILIAMSQVLVAIGAIIATQIISLVLHSAASRDLHLKLGEDKDKV